MLGKDENPEAEKAVPAVSSRTAAREAFFLEFAKAIRQEFAHVPLLVTGGFRSRQAMEGAVSGGDCDMIGIARPAVHNPTLPKKVILNPEVDDESAVVTARRIQLSWLIRKIGVKAIGAGTEGVSFTFEMTWTLANLLRTGIVSKSKRWARYKGQVSLILILEIKGVIIIIIISTYCPALSGKIGQIDSIAQVIDREISTYLIAERD